MATILNPNTQAEVDLLIKRLPQSVLLTSSEDQYALDIARDISKRAGATFSILLPEKNEKIDLISGVIGVQQIRELYDSSRSKRALKHVTIISYGERMTHQAQNAFLKLLEEPGLNTHFIIVAKNTENLLDTILSRVARLNLRPITDQQSNDLISQLAPGDTKKQTQLRYIAAGMPGELTKLASDDAYFNERSLGVRKAMNILSGSDYDRLKIIHTFKDDRPGAIRLANDIIAILKRLTYDRPEPDLIFKLDIATKALDSLERNGNIRLVLARAFV